MAVAVHEHPVPAAVGTARCVGVVGVVIAVALPACDTLASLVFAKSDLLLVFDVCHTVWCSDVLFVFLLFKM